MIPWWLDYIVDDTGLISYIVDSKVLVPYKECGIFMFELLEYAFTHKDKKWFFARVIKNEDFLKCDLNLRVKDKEENFQDIKHAVNSYRYILSVFLSIGLIPKPDTPKREKSLNLMIADSNRRADILEFFLSNNTDIQKPNQKSYYYGKIELALLDLVKELYYIGKFENEINCKWLTAFNSPIEIWFLCLYQNEFLMWLDSYYKVNINERLKFSKYHCEDVIHKLKITYSELKNVELLCISEAIKYTVAKLFLNNNGKKSTHLYMKYTEAIRSEAYHLRKSKDNLINY